MTVSVSKTREGEKNVGPSWLVTVPENYTKEEMKNIAKRALEVFPNEVVGCVLVVPKGVTFSCISDTVAEMYRKVYQRYSG